MIAGLPDPIPDELLSLSHIPYDGATWEEVARFAATFNGYKHWGSFQRCAEIANAQRAETLTDLRTCLFFERQRWAHFGGYPDAEAMEYIRRLVADIREKVSRRQTLS